MGWIEDNKGAGPWDFKEQPDVFGYLNNKNWSKLPAAVAFSERLNLQIDREDDHKPCGHWHKNPTITIPVTFAGDFWQQSVDVIDSAQLYAVGAMIDDEVSGTDGYLISIYDFDLNVIAAHKWEEAVGVSTVPGTIHFRKVGGVNKAYYVNYEYLLSDRRKKSLYYLFTLDVSGNYSKSLFYSEEYTDSSNYVSLTGEDYLERSFAVSSTGTVVTALPNIERVLGVSKNYITIRRSVNGTTWNDAVKINIGSFTIVGTSRIEVDSNDTFYIVCGDSGLTPQKPFRLWKSTDDGLTFDEILTVPSTPAVSGTYSSFDISGTKLYVVCRVYVVNIYYNYLWYSTDAGATWTRHNPTLAGNTSIRRIFMAANGDTIIMACKGSTNNYTYILRSADSGANWTQIGRVNPELTWPELANAYNVDWALMNNDGDHFVYTVCGLSTDDSDLLAILESTDDGLTWEAKSIPVGLYSDTETIIGITTTDLASEEPVVWPFT